MTTVGSFCTGYGGLDLGLELALGVPLRHAWHVENDGIVQRGKRKGELTGPRAILAARFPNVPNYGDLKTLDYSRMEPVDWITAGYPCQPFSNAGKRLGEADERHLWPYIAEAIGALRPRNVLLENVRGHVRRGLPTVIADLAYLGYDARWGVVRASDAGAPHQRERVFIAASDASCDGRHEGWTEPARQLGRPDAAQRGAAVADAVRSRLGEHTGAASSEEARPLTGDELASDRGLRPATDWGPYLPAIQRWEQVTGRPAPRATEPRGRGGAERLSPRLNEWLMGLPDGWVTSVPGLTVNQQLTALGNGVVPQSAALAVRVLLGLPSAGEVAA